jgi:hypothetical protein
MNDLKNFNTNLDIKYYRKKILKNESKIIRKYNSCGDGGTGLGENSLTSRFAHFNLLKWFGVRSLKNEIIKKYINYYGCKRKFCIRAWANVMRKGEKVKPHVHVFDDVYDRKVHLSGNLLIYCDTDMSTYYGDISIPNINGNMTLFPSNIPHETDRYDGESERISIAFDIATLDKYSNFKNILIENNFIVL